MLYKAGLLAGCLAAAALTTTASAASPADEQIRAAGATWLREESGIGLSIALYENGQRRFYNFGLTQLEGGRPVTQDTVYEIGSISKTFTGQLLARAIVEGRAQPDDEVSKHLPEAYPNLANGGEPVRLVHLANSTSQLIDNIPDLSQVRYVTGEPLAVTQMRVLEGYSRSQFLAQLHAVAPRSPPGSPPSFSNVGGMLLGVALEKIYGLPFEQILAREIEKPLRMRSGFTPPASLIARGHTATNDPLPAFIARTLLPTLTLRYSASDLLNFASWQMAERDASVKFAHRPTWTQPDGRQSMAYHWIVGESPRGRLLRQTGSTFGFTSLLEVYPDAKIAIVLLANKNADGAQESLRALSADIVTSLRPATESPVVSPPPPSSGVDPQPAR
jgi:serine-type D-Ala-D-Ala carboxypeptidase/endopeptidase